MFNWSGNKASFMGQLGFYGKSGIDFYTNRKTTTSLWPAGDALGNKVNFIKQKVEESELTNRRPWRCHKSTERILDSIWARGVSYAATVIRARCKMHVTSQHR